MIAHPIRSTILPLLTWLTLVASRASSQSAICYGGPGGNDSDGGALAEVVSDTGLKFPPGDDEALAACLERVLQWDDFAAIEGDRARERAKALLTESRMVAKHLVAYRVILRELERSPTRARVGRTWDRFGSHGAPNL